MNLRNDVQFQLDAIAGLAAAMAVPNKRDVILKAPTGSGKTIILTRFMHEYMRDNPSTAFVWLTPGKGDLEEQSKAKMDRYCHNAATKLLPDVMTGGFAAGDAVFINWEQLNKKGNNALKESERTNFKEWVQKAHDEGVRFKVVVDESHQGDTAKSDEIVSLFKTDKIIRASATPKEDKTAILIEVNESDVIAEGLIKKLIHLNPDFPKKLELGNDDKYGSFYLLDKALVKRNELQRAFNAKGAKVNPLVLVQLPDKSDEQLDAIEEWLGKRQIDVESGTLAVWLAERHDNLEGISENDGKQMVVVLKQAVATGWDCPRAHILVKLRHNMGDVFEIQTIGRIRRMPEAKHYRSDLLDTCYVYTLDPKFTEGLRKTLGDKAPDAKKVFIKQERKTIKLITEQRPMVPDRTNGQAALKAVSNWFAATYKTDRNEAKNKTRLEAGGYDFREMAWGKSKEGKTALMGGMAKKTGFSDFEYARHVDTHRQGREFHHIVAEIGKGCRLDYEDCRIILFRMFGLSPEAQNRIMMLSTGGMYAFVINNGKKLKEDFLSAMAAFKPSSGTVKRIVEKAFHIPHEWEMTYDGSARDQKEAQRNVYKGYLMSARPRSTGEIKFEHWCEQCAKVEAWYRNGDKGDEYFSIVYQDNGGKQRLFYPDYILVADGETWIIEIKGGFNASGQSENIDPYAAKKAEALKAYCAKHHLRGGFVCHDEHEDILLLSQDGFDDDPHAACWQVLDDAFSER